MGRINQYSEKSYILDADEIVIIDSEIEDPSEVEALKRTTKSSLKDALADDFDLSPQRSEEVPANTVVTVTHPLNRIVNPYFVTEDGRLGSIYVYDVTVNGFKCESGIAGTVYYK